MIGPLATPATPRPDFYDPLTGGKFSGAKWKITDSGSHVGRGSGLFDGWVRFGNGDPNSWTDPSVWLAQSLLAGGFSVHVVPSGTSGSGTTGKGFGMFASATQNPADPTLGMGIYWKTYQMYVTPGDIQVTKPTSRFRNVEVIFTFKARPSGGALVYVSGGSIYGTWPTATLLWVWDAPTLTTWFIGLCNSGGELYLAPAPTGYQPGRLPAAWRNQFSGAAAVDQFNTAGALNAQGVQYTDPSVGTKTWTATTAGNAITVSGGSATCPAGRGYAGFDAGLAAGACRIIRAVVTLKATPWFRINFRGSAYNDDAQDFELHGGTMGFFINGGSSTTGAGAPTLNAQHTFIIIDDGATVVAIIDNTQVITYNNTGKNTQTFVGFEILHSLGDDGTTIDQFECWLATATLPSGLSKAVALPTERTTGLNEAFTAADGTLCTSLAGGAVYTEVGCAAGNHFRVRSNQAMLLADGPTALAGTVTTASGSGSVVGVGTAFTTALIVGDTITVNAESHQVTAITDNTHLTTGNWTGVNAGVAATKSLYAVAGLGFLCWDAVNSDHYVRITITNPSVDPGLSSTDWLWGLAVRLKDASNFVNGRDVYQSAASEEPEVNQQVTGGGLGGNNVMWLVNVGNNTPLGGTFTMELMAVGRRGYGYLNGDLTAMFPIEPGLDGNHLVGFGISPAAGGISGYPRYDVWQGGLAA